MVKCIPCDLCSVLFLCTLGGEIFCLESYVVIKETFIVLQLFNLSLHFLEGDENTIYRDTRALTICKDVIVTE